MSIFKKKNIKGTYKFPFISFLDFVAKANNMTPREVSAVAWKLTFRMELTDKEKIVADYLRTCYEIDRLKKDE